MAKGERTPAQLANDKRMSDAMKAKHSEKGGGKGSSSNNKQQKKQYTAEEKREYYAKKASKSAFNAPDEVAAAYSTGVSARKPRFISQGHDHVTVIHRELVASVSGTANFTTTSFALNPGISASFPWLSSVAQAWEQYRFKNLRYEYYTRTGSNVPGSMMLVPDFDAADPAPDNEQTAMSYQDAVEDAPWKNICSVMSSKDLHPNGVRKFIRTAALGANLDIKTYDAGNMFLCTTDGTAVNWGKVYAEYEVELFVPQLQPTGLVFNPQGGTITANGSISAANPLGATPILHAGDLGISVSASSVITLAFPGTYLVSVKATGTVMSGSNTWTTSTGVTDTQLHLTDSSSATDESVTDKIVSTVANGTITLASSASTQTATVVWIAMMPTGSV